MKSAKKKALFSVSRRDFMRHALVAGMSLGVGTLSRRAYGQTPAANERLGVAVIGCGSRGNGHLKALDWLRTNEKSVEIVAVCDIYRPRLVRAAEAYGAKPYMDHRELLTDPRVDVVFIATPDHHHGYQTLDAVRAGKDVFCEKPMTYWRQFDLAKEVAQVVRESGRVFQLGTQGMSDSAWHQMRQLVKEGLIGQPIHAECGYFRVGDWGERGMPIDDPNAQPGPDLNWEAFLGDAPKRPFDVSRFFRWRMYEDYAGGPVTDLYPHTLTPVVHILDAQFPSLVVATGGKFRYEEREVPDTFNVLADYPERFNITIMGTQGNDFTNTDRRGSNERTPVIRGWDGTLFVQGKEIVFVPNRTSEKKEQRFPIERDEDMIHFFRYFITCCRERNKETFSPVDLAYRTQTALIMAMWAYREGKVARFDPAEQKIVLA
ncbi:MAG TPA: Gfo/Idh/MocA family oxidoreductase [Candidatus Hydrogenedentes bacterium]|nr:Gfo/Idh/MocA family oxidoreductase [Candidatus Hydrogenedentota bacterium]HOL76064.1 Gfo/Idh/MocA family oxidoreductase [Candidatus Hydrogenedentota bacterium]HPO84678.1 Gfo/Idh/MocA family oxidoreductase [Candidatus Hydrogenedentota bacterium]